MTHLVDPEAATEYLRQTLAGVCTSISKQLLGVLDAQDLALLLDIPHVVRVTASGEIYIPDRHWHVARMLEYGTSKVPKLGLISRMTRFVLSGVEAELGEAMSLPHMKPAAL